MNSMKIGTKLLLAFLIIGLAFAALGGVFLFQSRSTLSEEAFNHLKSVREIKKAQIEYFFEKRQDHMQMLLDVVATFRQNAVQKLNSVQEHKKSQLEWFFQERLSDIHILSKSQLVAEALKQFDLAFQTANGKTEHPSTNHQFDLELTRYQQAHNYDDLFLITRQGDIVYSTDKNQQLGQNWLQDTLKNSYLKNGFQKGLVDITIQDLEPSESVEHQHAALLTAPIFDDEQLIGVLGLTLSPEGINRIVQKREGMGQTEQTYLVGALASRISYRSNRIVKETGQDEIGGKDINKALAGQSGTLVKMNGNGHLELSRYAPLHIPGLQWAIITTIELEESITPKLQNEEQVEDFFTRYIHQYGYYDLYLIHPQGEIFYSVKHKADYATNILNGKYSDSTLGNLVQQVLQSKTFAISDYAPYAPSYNDPHLFIAQPVLNKGHIELILALQLSDEILDQIMLERAGMGKSGETYLVGSDKLMRSNSFLDLDHHSIKTSFADPANGSIETKSSHAALAGETGEQVINNYLGHSVLSAYTPLTIGNTTWALIAEINQKEAFSALRTLEWLLGMIMLLIGIGAVILIHRFTASLLTPLLQVNEHLKSLALGKLIEADDIRYQGKDEIAEIIASFRQLKNSFKSTIEQANAVVAGDYTKEVKILSEQDQLGIALCEMTHTLDSQSQTLQKQQNELKKINQELEQRVVQRTQELALANQQITALNERLEAENLRMGAQLEIARQLQKMVLPADAELKKIVGLDIAGFMEPADEVGGDYYDVLQCNDNIVCGIGDVTGHGLESGVLMIMVQMAVRTLLATNITEPEKFLNTLNRAVYQNVQRMNSDKNLTMSLLCYHQGTIRFSGQHEEILVVRKGGYLERIDTFDLGFMVGLEADITEFLAQREVHLQTGDGIVLYTDGVTEARNPEKKLYGIERLCEVVSHHWQHPSSQIQQAIMTDVRQHISTQKIYDDITLLVIKKL